MIGCNNAIDIGGTSTISPQGVDYFFLQNSRLIIESMEIRHLMLNSNVNPYRLHTGLIAMHYRGTDSEYFNPPILASPGKSGSATEHPFNLGLGFPQLALLCSVPLSGNRYGRRSDRV